MFSLAPLSYAGLVAAVATPVRGCFCALRMPWPRHSSAMWCPAASGLFCVSSGCTFCVRPTDQTLSCTAKARVPKPERHAARLHVRRANARRVTPSDFDSNEPARPAGPKPGRASFCGELGRGRFYVPSRCNTACLIVTGFCKPNVCQFATIRFTTSIPLVTSPNTV